jgi:hypothetical protein
MRLYENMSRDQIHLAIAQEREILTAIEKYQAYLATGNGNPKDELGRLQLQISNSRLADARRRHQADWNVGPRHPSGRFHLHRRHAGNRPEDRFGS